MTDFDSLVAHGQEILSELEIFLQTLPLPLYTQRSRLLGSSSVGAHVRHSLDHWDAFWRGLDSGVIDYDQRERERLCEVDPARALERVHYNRQKLQCPSFATLRESVKVRTLMPNRHQALLLSSWSRELHFVCSHSVHHLAILRLIAKDLGCSLSEDFGKALSTLAYERQAEITAL